MDDSPTGGTYAVSGGVVTGRLPNRVWLFRRRQVTLKIVVELFIRVLHNASHDFGLACTVPDFNRPKLKFSTRMWLHTCNVLSPQTASRRVHQITCGTSATGSRIIG